MTGTLNQPGPLLTFEVNARLCAAARAGTARLECSLDLERTRSFVDLDGSGWYWRAQRYPFIERCKDRTIYHWDGARFEPIARYTTALYKLVPTAYGPPTFEIDGIKMLPTARVSPYADAERKVSLIQPRGKRILDTCGGLGYFSAWCLQFEASLVLSYEKSPAVLWLRSLNPWSPAVGGSLQLVEGDIVQEIVSLGEDSIDAVLHDPPRFGTAGELYSQAFYHHLARVLKRHGRLFHYTGAPNRLTTGRDVAGEVAKRLRQAGFSVEFNGDGVLAVKT